MAEVMGAEAAIVRTQFVSGTHAIATALYSVLRPGDRMLAVAGRYSCLLPLLLQHWPLIPQSSILNSFNLGLLRS